MKNNIIGDQIKKYRKRAKKSQLDLELAIGCSQGSISRIENGEVNPSKETLVHIIDVLNLKSFEAAPLLGLNIENIVDLVTISAKLNESLNLDETFQHSVDKVCEELNLVAGSIALVVGNRLYAQTLTQNLITKIILKVIPIPIKSVSVSLEIDKTNLMVKSIHTKQIYISSRVSDFTVPALSLQVSNLMQKVSGIKSSIALPLIFDSQAIGVISFGKSYEDNSFTNELPVLKAFAEHIAVAIHNAQKYETLKSEIEKLKAVNT
jgi:GAF domain-containing protein